MIMNSREYARLPQLVRSSNLASVQNSRIALALIRRNPQTAVSAEVARERVNERAEKAARSKEERSPHAR